MGHEPESTPDQGLVTLFFVLFVVKEFSLCASAVQWLLFLELT